MAFSDLNPTLPMTTGAMHYSPLPTSQIPPCPLYRKTHGKVTEFS